MCIGLPRQSCLSFPTTPAQLQDVWIVLEVLGKWKAKECLSLSRDQISLGLANHSSAQLWDPPSLDGAHQHCADLQSFDSMSLCTEALQLDLSLAAERMSFCAKANARGRCEAGSHS